MKHIILCADDYGQNEAISQAIIALLEKKRLSAVSCMTTALSWQTDAPLLKTFRDEADIGLHFNLTEEKALSSLLLCAHLRFLHPAKIEAELHLQLDAFEKTMGCLPDFIDGHQHIHQLPVVRDVLFKVYETRLRLSNTYIRCVYSPLFYRSHFKVNVIQLLTSAAFFRKELMRRDIPHNFSFAGIYDFKHASSFSQLFPTFLQESSDQGIIMCHPGLAHQQETSDVIAKARYEEFLYLKSTQFLQDCERAKVNLARFKKPYRN